MALTQAMCTSFRQELLQAIHDLDTGGDVFKLALFRAQAEIMGSFGAQTTNYSDMGADEVTGTNYTPGGIELTNISPDVSGNIAFANFANAVFTDVTLVSSGGLIYNSSKGDRAVAVLDFGTDKAYTAANLTVVMPATTAATALIRLTIPG